MAVTTTTQTINVTYTTYSEKFNTLTIMFENEIDGVQVVDGVYSECKIQKLVLGVSAVKAQLLSMKSTDDAVLNLRYILRVRNGEKMLNVLLSVLADVTLTIVRERHDAGDPIPTERQRDGKTVYDAIGYNTQIVGIEIGDYMTRKLEKAADNLL